MKRCAKCGMTKSTEDFGFRKSGGGTLRAYCKACQRSYSRAWYDGADKAALNERVRALVAGYRLRNRLHVYEYLRSHACVDCGITDPVVLEFDHVRGAKTAAISVLIRESASLARLEEEIAKCVVRCANCHRRRTTRQLRWKTALLGEGSACGNA